MKLDGWSRVLFESPLAQSGTEVPPSTKLLRNMDWSSFTRFKMMVQAVPRNLETSGLNQVALRASAKASAGHSLLSVPSLKSGSQVLLQGICRHIVSVL